jgi:hypothetical protein
MTDVPAIGARRDRRVVLSQTTTTACLLGAGLLFWEAASDLRRPFVGWSAWSWPLGLAAVGLAVAGVLPWVWADVTVRAQRLATWPPLIVGTAAALGALVAMDLTALVGAQLALGGAVLSELGSRRRAVQWFVATAVVLWLVFVTYHALVSPRPTAD